jgi:hypothetical protein
MLDETKQSALDQIKEMLKGGAAQRLSKLGKPAEKKPEDDSGSDETAPEEPLEVEVDEVDAEPNKDAPVPLAAKKAPKDLDKSDILAMAKKKLDQLVRPRGE